MIAKNHVKARQKAYEFAVRQEEKRFKEWAEYDYVQNPNEKWRRQLVHMDAQGALGILRMYAQGFSIPRFWHTDTITVCLS